MLEILGATPDEVADSLRARGIKGVRNAARQLNPIVRFALSVMPKGYEIDLTQGDSLRMVFAGSDATEEKVPAAVLLFLERFHEGQYPDLELPTHPNGGSPP